MFKRNHSWEVLGSPVVGQRNGSTFMTWDLNFDPGRGAGVGVKELRTSKLYSPLKKKEEESLLSLCVREGIALVLSRTQQSGS